MKNHFSIVSKLVAAAVCALSLGSCSRAEYAMLPKGASYRGVTRAATPVPAAPAVVAAPAPVVAKPVVSENAIDENIAASAPVPVEAATAPEQVVPHKTAQATIVAPKASSVPVAKPTFAQRLALKMLTHRIDKLMQKSGSVHQHDNIASTAKGSISGNLRIGIILLLIGLLVGLINGFVGTVIAIIGLVFIVLWLLDQV